jgi:aldehyde:ferredoxin oxidoreductase
MEKDHFGYTGKLLRVNLGSGKITTEEPDESYYKHYLGGRGIIMHALPWRTRDYYAHPPYGSIPSYRPFRT